jgi:tRNA1(Val) A37 N6-methylase TrmN6
VTEDISTGTLLGGRVSYQQLQRGHRTGFEPVLLAAAVRAKAGERVLDAGTGAGAALLCLAARVPGIAGVGIEQDGGLAGLAQSNFAANGFAGLRAIQGDVLHAPFRKSGFDHVLSNPPWFDESGTASPDPLRAAAHAAAPALLAAWIGALVPLIRPGGSLTLILPAARLSDAVSAIKGAGCGGLTILPFWPTAGAPAKLMIVTARRASRAADRLCAGIALHEGGKISAAAELILSHGASLL